MSTSTAPILLTHSTVAQMDRCVTENTRKLCIFVAGEFHSAKESIIKTFSGTGGAGGHVTRLVASLNEERSVYMLLRKLEQSLRDVIIHQLHHLRDTNLVRIGKRDEETEDGEVERTPLVQLGIVERTVDGLFDEKVMQIQILSDDSPFENTLSYMYRKLKKQLLVFQANFIKPVRYTLAAVKEREDEETFAVMHRVVHAIEACRMRNDNSETTSSSATGGDICAICQYELPNKRVDLYTLRCNHSFHLACGVTLMAYKAECPICRAPQQ